MSGAPLRSPRPPYRRPGRGALRSGAAAAALLLAASTAPPAAATTEALPALVRADAVLTHMERFQTIADFNGGNRAHGTDGYAVSAMYVADRLEQAGYTPQEHEFEFILPLQHGDSVLHQTAPEERAFTYEDDFSTLTYSAPADVAAAGAAVAPDSPESGCLPEDFADFPDGAIAIMQRGGCTFAEKTRNAAAAGPRPQSSSTTA